MLTMDDIKYIRRMYEKEGCSIREIMKRTGYHYETVSKYLDMEDFNLPIYRTDKKPSRLDPLKPVIDQWLKDDMKAPRKQRHTAKRVYDRLVSEYPEDIGVRLRTVQYYVNEKKKELYSNRSEGYLPLEHPAGEAQADFCEFAYYDECDRQSTGYKLTLSFPQSNAAYCQIFKGENQECLLQGIKNIIEYMGQVPYRILFDNLSPAVVSLGKGHDRKQTEGFKRFMEHYGMDSVFCNPSSGNEKGNVENKVGYERRNMFVPIPHITDFAEFNRQLFSASEKDMSRKHYIKEIPIKELFACDRKAMLCLNPIPYNVLRFETVKTDKYGKVMFETNRYSSSPRHALTQVYIEVTSDSVTVMDKEYKKIASHNRLYGHGQESMEWLPYIDLISKRPAALKYTAFYSQLPEIWKDYLEELDSKEKRNALLLLHSILEKSDIAHAADALKTALTSGRKDTQSVTAACRTALAYDNAPRPMEIHGSTSGTLITPAMLPDIGKYDTLIKAEAVI